MEIEGDLYESGDKNETHELQDCEEETFGDNVVESLSSWEWRRKIQVVQLICYVVRILYMMGMTFHSHHVNRAINDIDGEKLSMREQLMKKLASNENCRDILRMGPYAFTKLCNILRSTGRLKDNRNVLVEEKVAKFLYILSHNVKNRAIQFFFIRSGETISRHFHDVLKAIISLEDLYLQPPRGSEVPPEIRHSSRFYLYFKDCVGAIDGTHIRVKVSKKDAPRYRGRKDYPTQNVLAACSFDMKFTYVLPGWEGTASDSRVIKNALSEREEKLIIPEGKYYLVDGGYMLTSGLITPYRGVRYHLKEYSSRAPENAQELFSLRHSSLRNVIERVFGVLKKRFPIISTGAEAHYPVDTVTEIVLAYCILHNYLMGVDPDERLIEEVERDLMNMDVHNDGERYTLINDDEAKQGSIIRNAIAANMWEDYEL
ncbi:uncharacterized protein LOC132309848 [Cornus florida]|uniref:uncharacterized protein LOC132309848 n=1 Tax=Cornus florida TaxID=4283 RepID=UPI00289C50CC|nr:uncharacterized protein LOC132309848 [Cornus florida]